MESGNLFKAWLCFATFLSQLTWWRAGKENAKYLTCSKITFFFPFKLEIRAFWNPWVLTDYANHLVENWTLLGEECATKYTQMQLKRLIKLHHLKHQPIFSKTLKWCKPLILMLQLNFLVEKHPLSPVAFRSTLFNSVIQRQYLLIWLCCTIVTGFCTLLLLLCKDYWLPIIFCLVG